MASLSGVSSSNLSSLYNSANTISGLASGMDTEGMIEQLVQSYSKKITTLQQKNTKIEWKQEAYRSMISKLVNISSKYTSYTSDTNLMSASFFSGASTMQALGDNASKVSVSGKGSSDVVLNAVKQLATAARYQTKSNLNNETNLTIQGEEVDLTKPITNGTMTGGLTLTYGGTRVTLSLTADDWSEADLEKLKKADTTDAQKAQMLANVLNEKLGEEKIGTSAASEKIKVTADENGNINFAANNNAGNSVYISGASGNLKDKLGIEIPSDVNALNGQKSISMKGVASSSFYEVKDAVSAISEKTFNINYNGTTKQITGPTVEKLDDENYAINGNKVAKADLAKEYANALNTELKNKFGSNSFSVTGEGGDDKFKLTFKLDDEEQAAGSTLLINTDAGDALGIGKTASNYLNTSSTLGKLLGKDKMGKLENVEVAEKDVVKKSDGTFTDKKGNTLFKKDGKYYMGEEVSAADKTYDSIEVDGKFYNPKKGYKFELNGETIGYYNEDTKLSDIMADINNNKDANVSVSFSKTSNSFVFTSKETGKASKVEFGDGLAQSMFGIQGDSKISDVYSNGEWADGEQKKLKFTFGTSSASFNVNKNDSMDKVLEKIQKNIASNASAAGYAFDKVDFDKSTGEFIFTKDDKRVDINLNKDSDFASMSTYTAGQDAIANVSVNGQNMTLTRSTNNFEIDGMTITAKEEFGYKVDENGKKTNELDPSQKVTFQSSVNTDQIVDAIKGLINDYNEVMSEVKSAYSTMPYQKSDGSMANYEPLTEEDMEGMSESAIEKYEAKAKQGILFNDRNLSNLYSGLLNVFSLSGEDGAVLKNMGITVNFSTTDGSSSVQLNESKLRSYLETNLDDVQDLFTRSVDGGASSNGIMQNMKTQLDRYAAISGASKGILVQEAGTPLYSLSLLDNNLQKQIDSTQTEIEKWQDKLSDRVDHYTSQFTRLELLINQMNSQSSALAGMLGG